MIALRPAVSVAAITAVLSALPAGAQVTPQQVWENWLNLLEMEGAGMSVDIGTIQDTGDRVAVADVVLTTLTDDLIIRVDLATLEFVAAPGGTVDVHLPEAYTMTFSDIFEEARFVMEFRQPGTRLTASGQLDALRYDFSAPEIGFSVIDYSFPDGVEGASADVSGRVVNSTGHYLFASDGSLFSSEGTMDSFSVVFDVVAPDDEGHLRGNLSFNDASSTVDMRNLHLLEDDPMMALMMGLSIDMGIRMSSATMEFDFRDGMDAADMRYASTDNAFGFRFDRDGFLIDIRGGETRFHGTVPDLPFPLEIRMEETAVRVDVPMTLEDAPPREFALLQRLVGLEVNDEVFDMFDPMRALPRTPATVILDITGVGIVNVMRTMMGIEPPVDLESMSLNELRVSFGGADLTGAGFLTFDMDDLDSFDGVPRPEGRVQLGLTGGNAFLDALGQLGLFGQEELMGIRMGLGMFGRSVGPDQIESVIEFTPDGGFSVNGMRLQ